MMGGNDMKKLNRLVTMAIAIILISSMFSVGFSATALELSTTEGKAQGETFGTLEGTDAGQTDYRLGKVSNYLLNMPTHAEITRKYNLSKDDAYYRNAFLTSFRTAYEIAYKSAYRESNLKALTEPFAEAFNHGATLGTVEGQIGAMKDYYSGYNNDWERALRTFVLKGSLRNRYNLDNEPLGYQSRFENGFTDSFRTAYIETYQTSNIDAAVRNTNLVLIDMYAKTIDFADSSISFTGGSMVTEASTPLTLAFPEATIYEPTYFSVYKIPNSFNMNNYKYVPVSSKFVISIDNASKSVNLNKPIELSFEYYGSERAGIYQWKDNQWSYLYTDVQEGRISTTIPAGYYRGGEYAIFIDESFKYISDIGFNWAYKEIYTLMRRDVIPDTLKFNPNNNITRVELADMLYQTLRVTRPYVGPGTYAYSDAANYGVHKNAIEYVVSRKYMSLDANGAFNPSATISYMELEKVMGMVLSRTFNWNDIASKMMYEKFARSAGGMDKNEMVTKAEAAYMLYDLFK